MAKLTGFVLLLAVLNVARAQNKGTPKYFKDGGVLTLELSPRPREPITNLVWNLEGNIVAEWFKDKDTGEEKVALTYYRTFKGRTTMDLTTGRLEITKMTKADMGVYSAEVNSVVQNERYDAVLIKEVPEPEVVTRPLVCSSASESCTLACEADSVVLADAGPVTYSWKKGNGDWKESGKVLDITKTETAEVETFTCRIQNPVGARESKPRRNPLLIVEEPARSDAGAIAGGIIGGILGAVALALGVFFRKNISKFLGCNSPDAAVGNGRQPESSGKSPEAPEELDSLKASANHDGGAQG